MREVKDRLGTLEANYAFVSRRLETRVERIEARLGLSSIEREPAMAA